MKRYELALILHPDLEIDLGAAIKRLETILKVTHATVDHHDNWGKQKLAYPIDGNTHGIYLFYQLQLEPTAVTELDNQLRLSDEIMRHLLIDITAEAKVAVAETATRADNKTKETALTRRVSADADKVKAKDKV